MRSKFVLFAFVLCLGFWPLKNRYFLLVFRRNDGPRKFYHIFYFQFLIWVLFFGFCFVSVTQSRDSGVGRECRHKQNKMILLYTILIMIDTVYHPFPAKNEEKKKRRKVLIHSHSYVFILHSLFCSLFRFVSYRSMSFQRNQILSLLLGEKLYLAYKKNKEHSFCI